MMPEVHDPSSTIETLGGLFARRGAEAYLGEPVSVAEHMLQCAALAEAEGAPETLVAAALLHDIGQVTSADGGYDPADTEDKHHDEAGAAFLAGAFPPLVVACVRLHVAAKRYLCATDPSYVARLSDASRHTLRLQGGPMDGDGVAAFRRERFGSEAVRVRVWDDGAKVAGLPTRAFADYIPLLRRVCARTAA